MILIFGGTTEGRAAVETVDAAGQLYYYSTRGEVQQVDCRHGVRVTGGMDIPEMTAFCRAHEIRLLIDAAHPFAAQLHRNIAVVSDVLDIPVIRYERIFPPREEAYIWCDTYEEAVRWLLEHRLAPLLALTGLQTIPHLRNYWTNQECWFRVLNRETSIQVAGEYGFPLDHLVFFDCEGKDGELFDRLRPAAILTKESGESGFFEEKVKAAVERDIPVVVIKRPLLSDRFYVVTGGHGLRHRIERLLPGFFPLNSGYTTGSCACAAAKAALLTLLTMEKESVPVSPNVWEDRTCLFTGLKERCVVSITLPCGEEVELPVASTEIGEKEVTCTVVKDAGDDPDVTNGCLIRATVSWCDEPGVFFLAGQGVGSVTLLGLGLEIGEPAINPVPRRMMIDETEKIRKRYGITRGVKIKISVPGGEEIAKKTFNPKLGIVGGISIIGTSGVVRPFSSEAFIQTIRKEIQVARALGCSHLVINSGAKSEKVLRRYFPELLPQAFVHYGNYIGETLKIAEQEGVSQLTMGIMIGKAVKLAEGSRDTHSRRVVMNRTFVADLAQQVGAGKEICDRIGNITFARELWDLFPKDHPFFALIVHKCREACNTLLKRCRLEILLIPETDENIAK